MGLIFQKGRGSVPPPLDLPHTAGTGQNIAVSPIITLHPVQDVNTVPRYK